MKYLASLFLLVVSSWAIEYKYGAGEMSVNGGFMGYSNSYSSDMNAHIFSTSHNKLGNGSLFYSADVTFFSSDNVKVPSFSLFSESTQNFQGFDINGAIGFDLFDEEIDNDFVSVGLSLGVSFPYLDIEDTREVRYPSTTYFDSELSFSTFKYGPIVMVSKELYDDFILVGSFNYFIHVGEVDFGGTTSAANGYMSRLDLGWKYFIKDDLALCFGLSEHNWNMEEIEVDGNLSVSRMITDFSMDTSLKYIGFSYTF